MMRGEMNGRIVIAVEVGSRSVGVGVILIRGITITAARDAHLIRVTSLTVDEVDRRELIRLCDSLYVDGRLLVDCVTVGRCDGVRA